MCQPGRPSPHGEGQNSSSPSLRAFQSAKSSGLSLSCARPGLLALVHLVRIAVGELAVAVEAADAEVDVAARLVGVPAGDQRLDQLDDLGDRRGRQRLGVRAADPEPVGVLRVRGDHPPRMLGRGHPRGASGVVDLVVDVGEVDHDGRLVALVGEKAPQQQRDHVRAGVADVDARVDRRPAGVDPNLWRLARLERRQLAAERVSDPHLPHRCDASWKLRPSRLSAKQGAISGFRPVDAADPPIPLGNVPA